MSSIITYVLFVLGFFILLKGAEILVEGASSVAKRLKISDLIIGLTIVALGTSAPELIVNIFASMNGNTDIAIGNIIGSNIGNILVILGISAIIFPLTVTKTTNWIEIPLSFLAVITLGIMANDVLFDNLNYNGLTRTDGLTLLIFFIMFMAYIVYIAIKNKQEFSEEAQILPTWKSIIFILLGLFGLVIGGKFVVDGAILIAKSMGLSEAFIGLTIVAMGTSLPELATSAVAAYRGKSDIAIGNIVGSNILNIFLILGVSAVISPLPFSTSMNFDIMILLITTGLLFVFMYLGKKRILERWQGILFLTSYIAYIVYLIIRG